MIPVMRSPVLAVGLLLLGLVVSSDARRDLRHWTEISQWYAACMVAWLIAGPATIVAGLWILASRGRRQLPFLVGGAGAILAGAVMLGGVLSYVIPCSGAG